MAAWLIFTRLIVLAGLPDLLSDRTSLYILHGGTIFLALLAWWQSVWLGGKLSADVTDEKRPLTLDVQTIVQGGTFLLGLYWLVASLPTVMAAFIGSGEMSMKTLPIARMSTAGLALVLMLVAGHIGRCFKARSE